MGKQWQIEQNVVHYDKQSDAQSLSNCLWVQQLRKTLTALTMLMYSSTMNSCPTDRDNGIRVAVSGEESFPLEIMGKTVTESCGHWWVSNLQAKYFGCEFHFALKRCVWWFLKSVPHSVSTKPTKWCTMDFLMYFLADHSSCLTQSLVWRYILQGKNYGIGRLASLHLVTVTSRANCSSLICWSLSCCFVVLFRNNTIIIDAA